MNEIEFRYYLARDNDGHWYVIPISKRKEWNEFLDIPSDDERSWDVPEWADEVGGHPSNVTFTNPHIPI